MYLTCGCGEPHKDVADNISYDDLKDVAEANGLTVAETVGKLQVAVEIEAWQGEASQRGARS